MRKSERDYPYLKVKKGWSMFSSIKKFFSSLAFWKKESPKTEDSKKPTPTKTPDSPPSQPVSKPVTQPVSKPQPKPVDDDGGVEVSVHGDLPLGDSFPLHYRIAYKEIGTKEIVGSRHSLKVLEYHDTTGNFSDDETPWCASYVNWVLIQQYWNEVKKCYVLKGKEYKKVASDMKSLALIVGTGSAMARSFASSGFVAKYEEVDIRDAKFGDIVSMWRGNKSGSQGHVTFFSGWIGSEKTSHKFKGLGGNQNNSVNISEYNIDRVLKVVRITMQAIA